MNHALVRAQAMVDAYRLVTRMPLYLAAQFTGTQEQDEVLELCLLDPEGRTLFHSLFRPTQRIAESALGSHRITKKRVSDAPRWEALAQQVQALLQDRAVVSYNARRILRLLRQTNARYGVPWNPDERQFINLQDLYARFHNRWDEGRGEYRPQFLGFAIRQCHLTLTQEHRALSEAQLTRAVLHFMAETCGHILELSSPPPPRHPRFYAWVERRMRAL